MLSMRHDRHDNSPGAYDRFCIAFLFLLSLLLMLKQLASSSYFTVIKDDAFIYSSWAWQFKEALKEGIIYPRWMPLNFWGYGSPTFLLYPPLAYFLVALFNVFTDSVITAMNVAKFTALFLSGTGIYFLVKEFYPARVALFSAIFCSILPFNIFQMYIVGSFAAMISCLWFSPILLFIYKFFKSGQYKYLIFSGVCYAGLILTHLVIAYMFTFVISAFVIWLAVIKKKPGIISIIPFIFLTGLSLSAAYILPVIFEKKYVNPDVFTTGTNGYFYSNMFILPDMTSRFSNQGSFWPVYYNTIVLHAAIFCLFILIFLVRSKYRESGNFASTTVVNTFFLVTAVCSILLTFGIASFFWKTIPFFKYILFPTRWQNITAFAVAFLSATLFAKLNSDNKAKIKHLIMLVVLFSSCLAWDFYYISGAPSYDKKELLPPIAVNFVMEHLPKEVRIDKIDKEHDNRNEAEFAIRGNGSAKVISWKSAERVLDVNSDEPLVVRFRTFNFPGWCAYMDGDRANITTEADTGAIMVNVPKGYHRLKLVFEDTPVRRYGKLISLVSLALLSIYLITSWNFMRKKRNIYSTAPLNDV